MTAPTPRPTKSSWPLVTLAALSFLPGLGILFAAVALSWALLSDRPRARLAGFLAAGGAILQIGGLLLYTFTHTNSREMVAVDQQAAQVEVNRIALELEKYHASHGEYPGSLELLIGYPIPHMLVNIRDVHHGFAPMAPDYLYKVSADGKSYDLSGRGADNQPGTEDDIRPVLSDSLREHSGYRPAR